MTAAAEPAPAAPDLGPGTAGPAPAAVLRVADRRVVVTGPAAFVATCLGPLRALDVAADGAGPGPAVPAPPGPRPAPIEVRVVPVPPAQVPPDRRPRATRWVPGDPPAVEADGVGVAWLPATGPMVLEARADAPRNDLVAERLLVPALAERLRREGLCIVHAACLDAPDGRGAWLVPAARGAGKTTLSLALRRAGFALLSDDRGFLLGPPDAPRYDPWPEAPRVGDRSLWLLPPDVAPGPRDPRLGKASVPALTPPRVAAPRPVAGILLPRLVEGPGGATTPVRGAPALAALATQAVVATDPATAAVALDAVAALLGSRPCHRVDVGDDAEAVARGVRALG